MLGDLYIPSSVGKKGGGKTGGEAFK